MGFDLVQVISDDNHYGAFVCGLCESLVTLDAVVTIPCSHPFCRDCLIHWAKKQISSRSACSCPTCLKDLMANSSSASYQNVLKIDDTIVLVQPLEKAQPLAFEVLKLIQVECIDDNKECEWTGDYGKWPQHMETQHPYSNGGHGEPSSQYARSLSMPSLFGNGAKNLKIMQDNASPFLQQVPEDENQQENGIGENIQEDNAAPPPPPPTRPKLIRGTSTRIQKQNRTKGLKDMKRQYKSVSDLSSPYEDDHSAGSKSKSNKGRRSKTQEDIDKGKDMDTSMNDSKKRMMLVNGNKSELAESHELEVSYGEMDWNTSISSIQYNLQPSVQPTTPSPGSQKHKFEQIKEAESEEFSLEFEQEEDQASHSVGSRLDSAKAIECSEKLKKQANAKFNKGDFDGARSLYSDGLDVMTRIITVTTEENELVATLFSNRAVTYFREKNFAQCIDDCDRALEYEPTYEKSYIRKWRALMALGNFEDACECLEEAHRKIPNSSRVKQELVKAREQKDMMTLVNEMIDNGELQKAKETIKPLAKTSDNIGLLLVAAMADAGLGLTESALEKVNKALRFNPKHIEALQLRGLVLFLSGEMEKGVRLLQELYNSNSDNPEIQLKLEQCQTTFAAFSKGRSYAKRSRYEEAVEQFSVAFESGALPLPSGSALYCLLKIEKAEALLLSKRYNEALSDCLAAIETEPENAEAWALKAEILICLGRAQETKAELSELRRTWGADNYVIEDAYRKANFELKVKKVDDELLQLVNDIEGGVSEKVIIEGRDRYLKARSSKSNQSERRLNANDKRTQMEKRPSRHRSFDRQKSVRRSLHKKEKTEKKSKREHHRRSTPDESGRTSNTRGGSSRDLASKNTGASSRDLGASTGTNGLGSSRKRSSSKKRLSRQRSGG